MTDVPINVSCKFEMYIFEFALVMNENVLFAFLNAIIFFKINTVNLFNSRPYVSLFGMKTKAAVFRHRLACNKIKKKKKKTTKNSGRADMTSDFKFDISNYMGKPKR